MAAKIGSLVAIYWGAHAAADWGIRKWRNLGTHAFIPVHSRIWTWFLRLMRNGGRVFASTIGNETRNEERSKIFELVKPFHSNTARFQRRSSSRSIRCKATIAVGYTSCAGNSSTL